MNGVTAGSDDSSSGQPAGRLSRQQCHNRGQTTLDFTIGISVFLAVLIFIFLFVPGLLSPFTTGTQEETVTSNRVADQLVKSTLGGPESPFVLDTHCSVEFFENTTVPARCEYDSDQLSQILGLDNDRQNVNITIRGNVSQANTNDEVLCWDHDEEELAEEPDCGGANDVLFTRGGSPPQANDESVTAVRVVSLNRQDVTLYVEMW